MSRRALRTWRREEEREREDRWSAPWRVVSRRRVARKRGWAGGGVSGGGRVRGGGKVGYICAGLLGGWVRVVLRREGEGGILRGRGKRGDRELLAVCERPAAREASASRTTRQERARDIKQPSMYQPAKSDSHRCPSVHEAPASDEPVSCQIPGSSSQGESKPLLVLALSIWRERKKGRQRAIDSPSQISTRARNIDPRQRSRRLCPPSVLFPAVLPAPPSSSPQRARAMTCMTCCATFPRHVPLRCPRASHVPGPVLHAPSPSLLSPPSLPPPAASLLAGA